MPLLSVPSNINAWREKLFAIDDPIELSEAHFESIWPHVDNIWVYHQQATRLDGTVVTKYHCRARRQRKAQPKVEDPKKRRNRAMRDSECRTPMVKEVKDGIVRLHRRGDPHAHSLSRSDQIKKSTYLRATGQTAEVYEQRAREQVNTALAQESKTPEQTDFRFKKAQEAIEASYYRIRKEVTAMHPDGGAAEDLMNVWIDGLLSSTRGTVKVQATEASYMQSTGISAPEISQSSAFHTESHEP